MPNNENKPKKKQRPVAWGYFRDDGYALTGSLWLGRVRATSKNKLF